jgi:Transcription factor WhiB
MGKQYQTAAAEASTLGLTIPEEVSVALAEIAESATEGLLVLAVGAGLQVLGTMMEKTAPGADVAIAQAKAVCRRCPVRLLCRIHADETGEYGVYAGETHTERTRRLRRWRQLKLPA